MKRKTRARRTREIPPVPVFPLRWVAYFFGGWLLFGCLPLILIFIGGSRFAIADHIDAEVAGTIGDACGLVNSICSGAALMFVIWNIRVQQDEIRFARDEWRENTESQEDQADLMEHTVKLSAINNIYSHYSKSRDVNDVTGILGEVASGHRRWAIREMFDSIDDVFEKNRLEQVQREALDLLRLLEQPTSHSLELRKVAFGTASLLVDRRLAPGARMCLWDLYEILRQSPRALTEPSSVEFARYTKICAQVSATFRTFLSPFSER